MAFWGGGGPIRAVMTGPGNAIKGPITKRRVHPALGEHAERTPPIVVRKIDDEQSPESRPS